MASWVLSIRPQSWVLSRFPASASDNRKSNLNCSTSGRRILSVRARCFSETKHRTPSVQTQNGYWEEPDDGSDSENEDEEEDGIGNNLDFESDWEEDAGRETDDDVSSMSAYAQKPPTDNYDEEIAREVEQLLEPEEMAILQENALPNLQKISTNKWKPLQTLALSMQMHYMDKLIANGLDINDVDKFGLTALHKAIIGRKEAVISHLLRKGANPHVKDRDGATPLHYAVQVGAMQTVKLLIKYNVDVNVSDNEGWTPLHIAVQSRNRDIAKILLINGADKTRRTKDGKTALDLALCYGRDFKSYDLAKLLKILPAV
ncbi:PREDICTED: ankyrin repeat domain-containing protein EMB506, chloroplastic [Tarenaya hassleriana]|uniref:ankyrin repeat domain-containing protein EMB506, chloroplastic n=1 Tax=Tarenaya hassleriana TaxID=28532 RepID=UPI00053C7332|nr:PREDICTED: ankyrin repeat domain-containing protein EMB506, chloroplastic [Tarenaya hassleriana]